MARILKIISILLLAAVILPFIPCSVNAALAESDGMVRVKLTRLGSPTSITFTTGCDYYIDADATTKIPGGSKVTVSLSGTNLIVQCGAYSLNMGSDFTLNRKNAGTSGVKFTSPALANVYCGDFRFYVEAGKISTVMTLYVEDYLYGVVGYEMSNSYPLEALKAQAIAARNYVLRAKSARSSKAYDVVDTSSDQVFRGYNSSYTNVIKAVDATRGMVLCHDGKLAACFYSASNGGQTESTRNAWGSSLAYSVVKDDRYDLESGATTKSVTLKKDLTGVALNQDFRAAIIAGIAEKLTANGFSADADVVQIEGITAVELHSPRYAEPSRLYKYAKFTLKVSSVNAGGERVSGEVAVDIPIYGGLEDWFSLSINSGSNETVYVDETDEAFKISLLRNGHGVGMSQRGAKVMAQNYSMDCGSILDFYYPGTELTTLNLSDTTGSGIKASGDGSALEEPLEPAKTPAPEATAAPAEEPVMQATVKLSSKSSVLNMRKSATTSSAIVARLRHGTTVDVYALEGSWVSVGVNGVRGYVMKKYLVKAVTEPTVAPTPAPTAADRDTVYAQVKLSSPSSRLKLRKSPSTSASVLARLKNGQYVIVTAVSGNWAKVQTGSGQTGYVYKTYLKRVYPASAPTAAATPAAEPTPSPVPEAPAAPAASAAGDSLQAVTVESTFIFSAADDMSRALIGIDEGTQVTVTAYSSQWAYVIYGDIEGYVPTAQLKRAD